MRNLRLAVLVLAVTGIGTFASDGRTLSVITSIPDFADIAREIGGSHVTVESMAKGVEDTHAVPVRPSLAAKLARADVLIEMGLEMEHAWLPALVDAANNPKIKHGKAGSIIASEDIPRKEVPAVYSRTEGEQHPEGNPHMNLGPDCGRAFAKNIAEGFIRNAPTLKADFETNLKKYLEKLDKKEAEWKERGKSLKGIKFVSFHPDMAYLADFFEMEQVGTIEPKPGIPPSASHTAELIKTMKERGTRLVLREPQYSDKLAIEIAEQTGAKVATIAIMVNGVPDAKTWINMIDANLEALLQAVK
jgi:ABC-type Zn uptake system ZnuABC Zn-binding protein ZnuA